MASRRQRMVDEMLRTVYSRHLDDDLLEIQLSRGARKLLGYSTRVKALRDGFVENRRLPGLVIVFLYFDGTDDSASVRASAFDAAGVEWATLRTFDQDLSVLSDPL